MADEIPETLAVATSIVKKQKTGGRAKKTLEQLLAETQIRAKLAGMDDDTNIPEELAAIYLCTTVSELAQYRKPVKTQKLGTGKVAKDVAKMGAANASPPRLKMVKIIRQGAVGQNQQVFYQLAHLREFRDLNVVESSFEAAVKAGLYGHMTVEAPFFAQRSKRSDRGRPILIGNAWDQTHPRWAILFKELFDRKLTVVWMTSSEAAKCRWKNLVDHKLLAETYFKMLNSEALEVKSALEGSEFSLVALGLSLDHGRLRDSHVSLYQTDFPRISNDGGRQIQLRIKDAPIRKDGSQTGSSQMRDYLRECKFRYLVSAKLWAKNVALAHFELDPIKLESWALEANYVEANFYDDSGALLASYQIHKGQWAVVVDRWDLMKT